MSLQREPAPAELEEQKVYLEMGMTATEFTSVKKILGRPPNYTELGLFSVMWSEHCSYKNSKPLLKKLPTEGKHVLQGPGEGAGIVDIGDNQAVVFKMESHNHPSAVEPYQGAATGVGGIIRDVFSMGARPIASLDSLRFGELDSPRVRYLFEEIVAGIAGYGNCIGIPTVGGEVQFDPCYDGNPLVNVMCVGIINHADIKKGWAGGAGNPVMYVGAATGRDGIHGATFASEELSERSGEKRPAVQVGDPFMEKLLLEACLELVKSDALVGIQDMGAAGLISSSSEMASKADMGMELELDKVPQRETEMTPYEMMLSESQERMLIVVKKGREGEVTDLFSRYGLHAVTVGKVTAGKMMRLFHRGAVVAQVPADALAKDAPVYHRLSREPAYYREFQDMDPLIPDVADYNDTLMALLKQPTIASKAWVYGQYDYQVRTNTVVPPGSDAAVLRIRDTEKALAMTTDCNARYIYLDPETGGKIAVAEAARNIVCSGGKPLAITDCLNYGNPEKPEIFWQMEKSVAGMGAACLALETPVIGGNVSLYNEKNGASIYPTPTIGMVGLVEKLAHITTQEFKCPGDLVYLIGRTKSEFGGSELQKLHNSGRIFGKAPAIDLNREARYQRLLLEAIRQGLVRSAHDVAEGGLAVAVAESVMGTGGLGVDISVAATFAADFAGKPHDEAVAALFAESQSRFVVSVAPENQAAFEGLFADTATALGRVADTGEMVVRGVGGENMLIRLPVPEMEAAWKGAIPCQMK